MKKHTYSSEEGKQLTGKIVQCDMAKAGKCNGKECHGLHNEPHEYFDVECFAECNWSNRTGICIEVKK